MEMAFFKMEVTSERGKVLACQYRSSEPVKITLILSPLFRLDDFYILFQK